MVVILVFLWHGKRDCFGWIDGLAPEFKVPVDEGPVELIYYRVLDNDGPGSNSGFAPVCC